jgi:hypothetical protein
MSTSTSRASHISTTAFTILSPARIPTIVARTWQKLMGYLFNTYRPELHYMRGPGPKWRKKYGHAVRALQ